MKDSREFLRTTGLAAGKGVAGLFALSWMGAVLFPLTIAGLIVLAFCILWMVRLYRRKATMFKALLALAASGVAIFTANVATLYSFSGSLYFFSCSAFDISCTRTSEITAHGRPILVVPVWAPKASLLQLLFGGRSETYFPSVLSGGGRSILHAPLEEQALLQAAPSGRPGRFAYSLSVNLPHSELSIAPARGSSEVVVNISSQTGLAKPVEFETALSNSVPGQFSISVAGGAGPEEWRRLVFSNETIRALMADSAASVVAELAREATRTGLPEDFARYATIKLALNEGFYAGQAGASQRLFELRQAIHRVDEDGDFRITAERPWNRAFIMQGLETVRELRDDLLGAAPEQRRPLAGGTTLSVRGGTAPWRREWEWLGERGQGIWAAADPEHRFGNAMVSRFFDGSISGMSDFFAYWERLAPPDRDRLRAREINARGEDFERVLLEWLAADPSARPRRIAVMDQVITESMIRVAMAALLPGGAQARASSASVRTARAQIALYEARARLLENLAATEFQRIQMRSGNSVSFDRLLGPLEVVMACGEARRDCDREMRAYLEAYARSVGSGSAAITMMIESAMGRDPDGRRLAELVIRLLDRVALPLTTLEFDQVLAPTLLVMTLSEKPAMRSVLPQVCAAADRYSRMLNSEPESRQRVFLHEGAILLALACERPWVDSHRLALARNGLDPGNWVLLIQRRAFERRAASRPGPG